MSVVQRVIILNKPFKIRNYTIVQWFVMGVSLITAFLVATNWIPKEWKLGHVPVAVLVFVAILGVGLGYVHVIQVKPLTWWRNRIIYPLGFAPSLYLPKREEGQEYPDSSIKREVKREDQSYVEVERFAEDTS